ncbi:MAG TPA: RidA family protein [Acidimicrobiaceae bacterium]|nr:hypothetical protein [Actinomycetota bacterium]HAN07016.1 RidA family protein [Acidimicrobiaceae bacterium]
MKKEIRPENIAAPAANYAHAILTTKETRWLHTSGVVPIAQDGSTPANFDTQLTVIWQNISAMLKSASMKPTDIVSVTTYVLPDQNLATLMKHRDTALDKHKAASTLVIVASLAKPEWLVEISVVAASK